jgi:hypothetical protein
MMRGQYITSTLTESTSIGTPKPASAKFMMKPNTLPELLV